MLGDEYAMRTRAYLTVHMLCLVGLQFSGWFLLGFVHEAYATTL